MEIAQNFKVLISKELDDKINWLTNNYDKEIGAWLVGEITNEEIIIEDFLIPNQEVSSGSVDTSAKSLIELRKEYGDRCKKIIGHWHSHNSMGAFWSATDEEFIEQFVTPRKQAIFIVSSQNDKHKIRLELTKPFKISLDDLDYKILYNDSKIGQELNKIIKNKCKEKESVLNWWDKSEEELQEELTKEEINKMVCFNKKDNSVVVKSLTLFQFYQLEGLFPIKQEVFNSGNKVTMVFKPKTKERAIELIKDLKDYMIETFKEKEIDENKVLGVNSFDGGFY